MSPASGEPFQVTYSDDQVARVRRWLDRATARGQRPEFLAVLKYIQEQLRQRPTDWGERTSELPAFGAWIYHAARSPLHLYYAVDEGRRIVYVRQFHLLPNHALGSDA